MQRVVDRGEHHPDAEADRTRALADRREGEVGSAVVRPHRAKVMLRKPYALEALLLCVWYLLQGFIDALGFAGRSPGFGHLNLVEQTNSHGTVSLPEADRGGRALFLQLNPIAEALNSAIPAGQLFRRSRRLAITRKRTTIATGARGRDSIGGEIKPPPRWRLAAKRCRGGIPAPIVRVAATPALRAGRGRFPPTRRSSGRASRNRRYAAPPGGSPDCRS